MGKEILSEIEPEGAKEILVPLTQSLYVPGVIVEAEKVLVDIGTGYYAEKTVPKAKEMIERKQLLVAQNRDSLTQVVKQKKQNLEAIQMVMMQKIQAINQQRNSHGPGKEPQLANA